MTRAHVSLTRHLRRVDHLVRRHGFAIQYVADPEGPSWAYTIGFEAYDHPEAVVLGIDAASAAHLLKAYWYVMASGEPPTPHRTTELELGGVRCGLIDLHGRQLIDHPDLLLGARRYWEHHGRRGGDSAVQIVWSDPAGSLPWEAAFDPRLERFQPLLDRPDTDPHRWHAVLER